MMQIVADFRIQHEAELYEKLDAAVAAAHGKRLAGRRQGVLVTRHDFDHFSVALSPDVPSGTTREHDETRRM